MTVVSLRGKGKEVEIMVIDVLLESEHALGWKGWMTSRAEPKEDGPSLLWMNTDWVEFARVVWSDR